jgi:hypothetical protein
MTSFYLSSHGPLVPLLKLHVLLYQVNFVMDRIRRKFEPVMPRVKWPKCLLNFLFSNAFFIQTYLGWADKMHRAVGATPDGDGQSQPGSRFRARDPTQTDADCHF